MPNLSRRDFARLLAVSGAGTFVPGSALSLDDLERASAPLPPAPREPDEAFWRAVRAKFLVPRDVGFFNAANLCPMPLPVLQAIEESARGYEANPSPSARSKLMAAREDARRLLAASLRVTPEEIVITRNTTEGNNFVSSGLTLRPGDEVLVSADNHPSNLNAWRQKGARFGFTVVTVDPPERHPGTDAYLESFTSAMTPRTRVLAITHVSSNSGDLLPVTELCRAARERGVLSLVDGAQSFGALDVNLREMGADFFTGSMHKWPCGPKEKGVLYVNHVSQDRLAPTIVGLYGGAVGISRTFEAEGQRDDAAIAAVASALRFQEEIGRDVIEKRARFLAAHLMAELRKLDGVHFHTDGAPDRSAAIVIFRPGPLDPRRLGEALETNEKIVVTARGANARNAGLRVSPHVYNTLDEVDRFVAAVGKYLKAG